MNRRGFLRNFGAAAAAVVAAPVITALVAAIPESKPIAKPLNSSLKWYEGYDSFSPPTSSEVLDAAEYQWKQLSGFVSVEDLLEKHRVFPTELNAMIKALPRAI